jgi:hypothetical protein
MVDETSHSVDLKFQTFLSVNSSHIYIRIECCFFDQDLARSFCDENFLAYHVLPLEIDLMTVIKSQLLVSGV